MDRRIDRVGSLHDGKPLLHVVDVESRHAVTALGGIILGIAVSYLARIALHHKFQTLPILITPEWLTRATIIAIIGSLLGAVYPALKAAQKDPIDALAYE